MPRFDFTPLLDYAEKNSISVSKDTVEKLNIYGDLLLFWNEKINLTAITDPKEVVIKHFIDS